MLQLNMWFIFENFKDYFQISVSKNKYIAERENL